MANEHEHSIILIKNTFSDSRKFLVYDDTTWHCMFFPNCKGKDTIESIRTQAAISFDIPLSDIEVAYIGDNTSVKYSEKDKREKEYHHTFYAVTIKKFLYYMTKDTFFHYGKSYHWKSISELKQDKDVEKKNMDIVSYVEILMRKKVV